MSEKRRPSAAVNAARREGIQTVVPSWFGENARDLPWRRMRDAWRVLVSRVMLQQIQVRRAVPFYEHYRERFPTPTALASAPPAEAIRVWEALGRYHRVVYLHRTARPVIEEHGDAIPSDPEELVKRPDIGPYTARAVACVAFERDVAFCTPLINISSGSDHASSSDASKR